MALLLSVHTWHVSARSTNSAQAVFKCLNAEVPCINALNRAYIGDAAWKANRQPVDHSTLQRSLDVAIRRRSGCHCTMHVFDMYSIERIAQSITT
jgi:hypothetical protein